MRRVAFFFLVVCGTLAACQPPSEAPADGATLATQYCLSCHSFPTPDLLPRQTWEEYVLPRMGYFLGHYSESETRNDLLEPGAGGKRVEKAGIFPPQPVLPKGDWQKIQDWYLSMAPDTLGSTKIDLKTDLDWWQPRRSELAQSPPGTTLAQFAEDGGLWIGDAQQGQLWRLDEVGATLGMARTGEGVVDLHSTPQGLLLTVMGSFSPTDGPSGYVLALPFGPGKTPRKVIDSLQRPVQALWNDIDGDGYLDAIISEYAKWTGKLALWRGQPDGSFQTEVLVDQSGAISSALTDLNGDGEQDLIALFGQGDEGFWVGWGQGQGNFQMERLLRFPSSYGSSSFQLLDWNGDGRDDILYTAGDNADYPPVQKPYHGIRLFINQGQGNFSEELFLPLPGAYGAEVADFDLDGDLDIAAISFFPDFEVQPEASFVLFQNEGEGQFSAHTFAGSEAGRWLVMDAADFDEDGDVDLVLGSLAFEVIPDRGEVDRWTEGGLGFLILENRTKP